MPRVKGFYHHALLRMLLTKYAEKAFTHESLARDTGQDTSTVGKYLRRDEKAGTMDLDEAAAALAHVGTTLRAFVSDPANVPQQPPQKKLSQQMSRLLTAVHGLEDAELAIVVSTARSVRARARRVKTQSGQQRGVGQRGVVRKTGGTR